MNLMTIAGTFFLTVGLKTMCACVHTCMLYLVEVLGKIAIISSVALILLLLFLFFDNIVCKLGCVLFKCFTRKPVLLISFLNYFIQFKKVLYAVLYLNIQF